MLFLSSISCKHWLFCIIFNLIYPYQEYLHNSAIITFSINVASPKPRSYLNPSRPNPRQRERINLNFYIYTTLWCLQRFYEDIKRLHKTFRGTSRKCENKNLIFIWIQLSEKHGAWRIKVIIEKHTFENNILIDILGVYAPYRWGWALIVMDNGCVSVVLIMGSVKVYTGRVTLINKHAKNARLSERNHIAMILRACLVIYGKTLAHFALGSLIYMINWCCFRIF